MPVPDHLKKLFTHSSRVMELDEAVSTGNLEQHDIQNICALFKFGKFSQGGRTLLVSQGK